MPFMPGMELMVITCTYTDLHLHNRIQYFLMHITINTWRCIACPLGVSDQRNIHGMVQVTQTFLVSLINIWTTLKIVMFMLILKVLSPNNKFLILKSATASTEFLSLMHWAAYIGHPMK